mmetsp:Transcript_44092/g.138558  ORF Transcript_44092/g.138558 Transcript_44092/m.138558 type:complete len:99 (+) Transcript_44092:30-326(+)
MSSSCVPCSTTRPALMTTMLFALRIVESRCAMTMTVILPCWIMLSIAACTVASLSASSADVASSRSSTLGRRTSARAMAMRCFCPPLSCAPRSPTMVL